MPPPNLLTILTDTITAAIPGWAMAIVAITGSLAGIFVLYFGVRLVLATLRGQVYYGGRFWDQDAYRRTLQRLHTQRRRGVLLDAESLRALRRYQGIREPRYRGNRSLPYSRW